MNVQRVVCASAFLALTFVWLPHTSHAFADGLNNGRHDIGGSIEPGAGGWRTWVISSGKDYRVPPPPGPALTRAELKFVANLVSHNSDWTRERIAYWDAGSPGYRWLDHLEQGPRGPAGDDVSAPCVHVHGAGYVQRDDCDVGIEIPLQTRATERTGSTPRHRTTGARFAVLPL